MKNLWKYQEFITEDEDIDLEELDQEKEDSDGSKKPELKGRKKKGPSFQELQKKYDYLKKEPKYIRLFHKFKEEENVSDQRLKDLYKRIQDHRNTLKQKQINIVDNVEKVEDVTDILDEMKLVEKTNKFVKLLPSHLRNIIKNSPTFFDKMQNLVLSYNYDDYKNSFMRKVAKYKNVDEFFKALENHISGFGGKASVFKDIEEHPGAEVSYSDDDILVARIYSKKASCDLGSQQWCISGQGGYYWDSYISKQTGYESGKKRPGVQYFVWDFSKDPSDPKSLIGVTVYTNNTNVAHDRRDMSINISNEYWFDYLEDFKKLSKNEKIRLIADNPEIETYTGIINNLEDNEKKSLLIKIPKLLKFFKDMSFLTNDEIWSLIIKDKELATHLPIAQELNDDQKIEVVVDNPDLLEIESNDNIKNPYPSIAPLLTRKQKIEMISNKHSLYSEFEKTLSEEEHLLLMDADPRILVTHQDIHLKVSQIKLKALYLQNKQRWDDLIASYKDENRSSVELLLSHLIKDKKRLQMEENSDCYIFLANLDKVDGYLSITSFSYIDNILDAANPKIASLMLSANFIDNVGTYYVWLSKDVFNSKDSIEDSFWDINNADKKTLELINLIDDNKNPIEQ